MKIVIIGSGAVGLGLAAFLIKDKNDVYLFAKGSTKHALESEGFRVDGIFGEFKYQSNDFKIIENYEDIESDTDYILITTKTLANREISENLCKIKDKIKNTKLVVIQNGWGNSETYLTCFNEENVFTSRIITGFYRKSKNDIEITVHADSMALGNIFKKELSNSLSDLANSLNNGGFDAKISEDVDKHLWAKILYNCALNPLGAILNVEYGKLAENEYSKNIMNKIIEEIYSVMDAIKMSTFWEKDDYIKLFYEKLIPTTYSHKSSMLQDLTNKRPTEIDSLNGIVVNLAKEYKKSVPFNEFVVDIIKSKEKLF